MDFINTQSKSWTDTAIFRHTRRYPRYEVKLAGVPSSYLNEIEQVLAGIHFEMGQQETMNMLD